MRMWPRRSGRRVRRTTAATTLALTALLASSCSVYDIPLPGGAETGDEPIHVKAEFRDVLDLVPQSTVKIDDVTVGMITDIKLDDYTAVVTMELPADVDLPDNTFARIRQTSLLGEKFVSLSRPDEPTGKLEDGDVVGLENTGRNPEVEEVFGALALLLNGGGVGQLKTITQELNLAFEGREDEVRSVITQVRSFMSQLDENKSSIVSALENLNRLALQVRRQEGTIEQALEEIPAAVASVDSQREDLVRLLRALGNLSGIGVEVIRASKASTIESLRNLAPVLGEFAKSGQDFPKAFQVYLTYPFVDDAVGRDPEVARNLHMGDFTNLSVDLKVDLENLPAIPGLPDGVQTLDALITTCERSTPLAPVCKQLRSLGVVDLLDGAQPAPGGGGGGGGGGGVGPLDGVTDPLTGGGGGGGGGTDDDGGGLGGLLGGLGRTAPGFDIDGPPDPFLLGARGVDPSLGTLLFQGVAVK